MYRRALRTASVGFMSPTVRATACGFGCRHGSSDGVAGRAACWQTPGGGRGAGLRCKDISASVRSVACFSTLCEWQLTLIAAEKYHCDDHRHPTT